MAYRVSIEEGFSDFYFSARRFSMGDESHIHSHMEFFFLQKGTVTLSLDGKNYPLTPGTLGIILPYEVHCYHADQLCDCFILACPPEYLPEYRHILLDRVFSPPIASYGEDTRALVEFLSHSFAADSYRIEPEQSSDLKKKALLYCALSELLHSSTLRERNSPEPDLYRNAILYLSHHYTQSLELSDVAQALGVSISHLSRVLSKKSGLGFSDILNSLRAHEARRLLQETNHPVSQIAFDAGFGSIRNFNRIFRQQFHCLPKDLRER